MHETIFALSSGILPSGVAVIRLSGKETRTVLESLGGGKITPRFMHYRVLKNKKGQVLDHGLVVYFPAPHSFTGEDCGEFHLHGGKAVVNRFLDELLTFNNCRLAEAGEFSRRAFALGKIDLTQAEGLADLIAAETESQRRLAIMGASGELATLYRNWRKKLIRARAMIEAELDFSDEEDIHEELSTPIWAEIAALTASIKAHVEAGERAGAMRDGLKIVLAGAPNAGKSSIINRLTGRLVALVTPEAGTTRDALEVRLILEGIPLLITDTAGLRETTNTIEQLGIEAAHRRIEEADLILLVEDIYNPKPIALPSVSAPIWRLGNKLDLGTLSNKDKIKRRPYDCVFSALNGAGFNTFIDKLAAFCKEKITFIGEAVPARKRQRELLLTSCREMESALGMTGYDLSLRAEHLRRAADTLGRITGEIDVEDLLDVIFSEFCIGK
ncbi:tRNA uridine-5-carboxymethylaminomethyl(34) synthesis GTPase MnmE [Bartonella sp. DGB2]|uniref:tRNA uridine-5-carboxymethylaminomethyl(34) synthesis GTPase MnmE n=1 Tax=Bartonella sp. DGB2 TaxID=3388426 RepID=UPI003990377B